MLGSQVKNCGQFYKLIVPSILQQKKLRIPKKFVRKFGHEFYGFATLTVPDDRMWLVTLREIDQKLWFCNGWHEFLEHYSICIGHFLAFKYEGNSNFSVYMYVLTPYKIKDQCTMTKVVKDNDKQHHVLDEIGDDDSVEIFGSTPICFFSDPLKHKILDECVEQNTSYKSCNPKCKDCTDEVSQNPSGGSVKSQSPLQSTQGTDVNRNVFEDSEDDVRLQFLDKIIQNLEKKIEKKQRIDEENLQPSGADDVAQRSTTSSQDVDVQSNSTSGKNSADDMTLKFSDESVKKLRKVRRKEQKIDPSEQQAVERDSSPYYKRASLRKRTVRIEERKRAINAANAFVPVNPFCRIVMCPTYLYKGCNLHLPCWFVKEHLNEIPEWIKLQFSDGKQWPVRSVRREGTIKLTQGWCEFSLENRFEEGDVCVFELLNSSDNVLKVTAFRIVEEAGCMNRP